MVLDNRAGNEPQGGRRTRRSVRDASFRLTALAVAAVSLLAATGFLMIRLLRNEQEGGGTGAPPVHPRLFQGWPKPDLALVLSGEQHGYLLPCGCSSPQVGGLERRFNFLQLLKEHGWPVAAVDLGDVPQLHGPRQLPNVQGLLKYFYAMKALKSMDYLAVGVGEYEMRISLAAILDEFALNNPSPRVLAANLAEKDTRFPNEVGSLVVNSVPGSPLKVGVVGLVGKTVADKVRDPDVRFEAAPDVLPGLLREMDTYKPDLRVLLYQGSVKHAVNCAEMFPQFHVILCLSDFDEAGAKPEAQVGDTLVIALGHKAKAVGVVGVYRGAEGKLTLRYQMVRMEEEFNTPKGQEGANPVMALLEDYTQELKAKDYLHRYRQAPHPLQAANPMEQPTYVGSETCKKCHGPEYDVWQKSKHAHAYDALVNATRPALRTFDGECVVCHVTGFGYRGGFTDTNRTSHLKHVGCESCHGPASLHVQDHKNVPRREALNPWKLKGDESHVARKARQQRIDDFCQKCHDPDNDVHWNFDKRWPDVAH